MQLQSPSFLWISSSVPKNSRLVHLEHYQVPRTKIDWFWLKMYQKKRCLMGLEPLQGIFSNILLTMNKDFQEAKKSYCIVDKNERQGIWGWFRTFLLLLLWLSKERSNYAKSCFVCNFRIFRIGRFSKIMAYLMIPQFDGHTGIGVSQESHWKNVLVQCDN